MKKADGQALFSDIINYFETNYTISASGKNNIKLGSRTHTAAQFEKRFSEDAAGIQSHVGRVEFASLVSDMEKDKGWNENRIYAYMSDKIFSYLYSKLQKASKETVTKVESDIITRNQFDWSYHLPIIDIKSQQQIMYDTRTKRVDHCTEYSAWKNYVMTRPSDDKKHMMASVIPAVIDYNPYKVDEIQFRDVGQQKEVLHVNAHLTPPWREERIEDPKLPKMFEEFMSFLFPEVECRKYVYHWMHFMLTRRNHCFLLLHGEQGVGKTTFAYVCRALVGATNYVTIDPDFWDSRFNHQLKYKRLAYFDETVITRDNVTKVRALTNKHLSIEEKGVNAINIENHCSYIIANNSDKKNLITYDDRRYSVPMLGKDNLKVHLGQDWLDEFYDKMETDKKFIGQIGSWILAFGDQGEYTEKHPYITDNFYDLVEKGMAIWQKNIVELLEQKQNDQYELASLKDELRGTGRTTLQGFLENHRDREGDHYGYVGQASDGARCLYPTSKYKPDVSFDSEEF